MNAWQQPEPTDERVPTLAVAAGVIGGAALALAGVVAAARRWWYAHDPSEVE